MAKSCVGATGVVTTLGDAATGGGTEAALATLGSSRLVADVTVDLGMDYHSYNLDYPN